MVRFYSTAQITFEKFHSQISKVLLDFLLISARVACGISLLVFAVCRGNVRDLCQMIAALTRT
jgi:hypothetical protein